MATQSSEVPRDHCGPKGAWQQLMPGLAAVPSAATSSKRSLKGKESNTCTKGLPAFRSLHNMETRPGTTTRKEDGKAALMYKSQLTIKNI